MQITRDLNDEYLIMSMISRQWVLNFEFKTWSEYFLSPALPRRNQKPTPAFRIRSLVNMQNRLRTKEMGVMIFFIMCKRQLQKVKYISLHEAYVGHSRSRI